MKSKNFTKHSIKGTEWTFYILTARSYIRKFKNDSEAITLPSDKEVYFRKDFLTSSQVRHELWHVFCEQTYTNSSNLTADQVEEKNAEIFAGEGLYLCNLTDIILNELLVKAKEIR